LAHFPLVLSARVSESESADLPVVNPTERACILFVDDEELVRYAGRAQLEGLGHRVLLARDGEAALECFRAHQDEIDLVILDLTMPRMGGTACLRALRAIAPSVRVVLSTGFGRAGVVEEAMELGVSGFLEKPYRQAELAEAIGAALGLGQRRM
jgi:CheY-like chemotaxis protein